MALDVSQNVTVHTELGEMKTASVEAVMRASNRMKRILREQWMSFLPATLERGR